MHTNWKSHLTDIRRDTLAALAAARGGKVRLGDLPDYLARLLAQPIGPDPYQVRARRLARLIAPHLNACYSAARVTRFNLDTPPIYSAPLRWGRSEPATDPARLPDPAAYRYALDTMREIMREPRDKCGVLLWGETGTGKSRTFYALGRLIARVDDVRVVTPAEIKAANTPTAWSALRAELMDGTTVMIDDLSHVRFSEAYASNLLDLIENITNRAHVPLVVTVQCHGRELISKWCGPDKDLRPTAEAIARRLAEFLVPVEFKRPRPVARPATPTAGQRRKPHAT